jgi:hypothetical protein
LYSISSSKNYRNENKSETFNVVKDLVGNLSIYNPVLVLIRRAVVVSSIVSENIHSNHFVGALDDVRWSSSGGFAYTKSIRQKVI